MDMTGLSVGAAAKARPTSHGGGPFELLGLPASAGVTDEDVRAAWRRIAAATHPDRPRTRRRTPRTRARPRRPAAGGVRPVRACRFARQHLQELRSAGAANRLDRDTRQRPARRHQHAEGLHDHLRERAERVPDRAGPTQPLRPPRPQPRDRAAQPASPRRLLRAARRSLRVDTPDGEPDRLPRVTGIHDLTRYCARLAEAGVLLLPGSVYDQPDHLRVSFGRANMPDALRLLEANLTNGQGRNARPRV